MRLTSGLMNTHSTKSTSGSFSVILEYNAKARQSQPINGLYIMDISDCRCRLSPHDVPHLLGVRAIPALFFSFISLSVARRYMVRSG